MTPSREWEMVVELAELINELETDEQVQFIEELYNHLDPFLRFLDQKDSGAEKWLYSLYEKYVNEDEDAAREVYED